ncbi:hypothetical protein AALO_G00062640 [Alosa alosa]|uniref:Uncharacterized protein n=1 Tax=Alosa alosa TaxID=278164 RepID=A0AAV6H0K6_9TELE|nr:hypothetical protein AALO_G00062640 [Alosa alosa]
MPRRSFSQPVGLDRLRFSEHMTSDAGKLMSENILERVPWNMREDMMVGEIWITIQFCNMQAKAYIMNLLHSRKRLMKMNANLQQALNASQDSKASLAETNARVLVEINEMQGSLDDSKMANNQLTRPAVKEWGAGGYSRHYAFHMMARMMPAGEDKSKAK